MNEFKYILCFKEIAKAYRRAIFSDKQQEDCLRRASRSGELGFRRVHTVSKYVCRHFVSPFFLCRWEGASCMAYIYRKFRVVIQVLLYLISINNEQVWLRVQSEANF